MEHTTSIAHATVDYKGKMKGPINVRGFEYNELLNTICPLTLKIEIN